MNFLDFIFDNLFIVAIIAIGLFNFLGSLGKKGQNENKRSNQPTQQKREATNQKPVENTPQRFEERIENVGRKMEEKLEEYTQRFDTSSDTQQSIEEQQKAQYERLKRNVKREISGYERTKGSAKEHKTNLKDAPPVEDLPSIQTHHAPNKVDGLNLEDKLTPKGLIDGVIMAEVLGPPRSQKPHHSMTPKRKR